MNHIILTTYVKEVGLHPVQWLPLPDSNPIVVELEPTTTTIPVDRAEHH